MMRQQQWRIFGVGLATVLGMCVAHIAPAAGQDDSPPPRVKVTGSPTKKADKKPPPPADAAYETSKHYFEAMPLADRRAVQDALVWVAAYKGTVDGTFGKRTRDALVAFETREGLNTDGIVDAGELKRLTEAARRAKEAVRFAAVADAATGMKLGLPLKLLDKRGKLPGGTRFFSEERGFAVETRTVPEADADLAKLFDRLRRDGADRKVTYKASKSDWFVVSGDAADRHFYTRFERKPGAETGGLRGYTITYPAAESATFDRYALAIANAVEAFPAKSTAAAGQKEPVKPAAAEPPRLRLGATGVAVAADRVLSVLPTACADPSRGKTKLTVLTRDPASGLALLEVAGATPVAASPAQAALADADSLVIVGFAAGADGRTALTVASGEIVSRSSAGSDRREPRVYAPLQAAAGGSAVFDRAGGFRGVVGHVSEKPRLVAGIVPQASYPLVAGEVLDGFLRKAGVAMAATPPASARTAGEIVRMAEKSVMAIDCTR